MIKVVLGTNTSRKTVIVEPNSVVKDVLDNNNVNYMGTTVHMDGIPLTASELHSSFADLGVTDTVFLVSIIKCDNA